MRDARPILDLDPAEVDRLVWDRLAEGPACLMLVCLHLEAALGDASARRSPRPRRGWGPEAHESLQVLGAQRGADGRYRLEVA